MFAKSLMKLGGKTVTIDRRGSFISSDEEFTQFWESQAGEWKVVATSPGLLILERRSSADVPAAKVLLGGEVKKEGWLIDIIGFISNSKWTGTLTVTSGATKRKLFLDKGMVRLATSNREAEFLGEIMVKERLISRRQLEEALKVVTPERRLGEILINQGLCTASDVFKMIHKQVEEIFYATLLVDFGYFYFTEELEAMKLPAILSLDTQALLLEAVKRLDEVSFFKKKIPRMGIVLRRKRRSFPSGMPLIESEFLGRCDGVRTLAEIAREMKMEDFDVLKMAYRFLNEEAIEVIMTEETYADSIRFAIGHFNSIIDVIHTEVGNAEKLQALILIEKNYIRNAQQEGEIPKGLSIDAAGHFDPESVLASMAELRVTNKLGYFVQVMTRYLFFVLFTACTYLSREQQQKLNLKVHTLIQKVAS